MRKKVRCLDPVLRDLLVCRAINGDDPLRIADDLQVNKHTVYAHLRGERNHFLSEQQAKDLKKAHLKFSWNRPGAWGAGRPKPYRVEQRMFKSAGNFVSRHFPMVRVSRKNLAFNDCFVQKIYADLKCHLLVDDDEKQIALSLGERGYAFTQRGTGRSGRTLNCQAVLKRIDWLEPGAYRLKFVKEDDLWVIATKQESVLIRKCGTCDVSINGTPAISRKDNMTDICVECSRKEAIEEYQRQKEKQLPYAV